MGPIQDHICEGLNILFVGFNPSIRSGETGHHFANPRNRFWNILYKSGLTPKQLHSVEDVKLLQYGYGLTNIVARPTKEAADITIEEYEVGRKLLKEKIEKYRPKVVCFVGKGVYEQYSKKRNISWGFQDEPIMDKTIEFVAPSSSGLVRLKMDDIIAIYKDLSRFIH